MMEGNWKESISTPALLVDFNKLNKNINNMAIFARDNNVDLRPHVKTHKCPKIGHMQLKAGAKGICVAKVGEAEVFAESGFDDILVANEVIDLNQIKRLVDLNKWIKVRVCVDSKKNVSDLSDFAVKGKIELEVLIDLNVGMGRVGVKPVESVLELANFIKEKPGINLIGLQAYEGHLTPMLNFEQKKIQTEECMKMAVDSRDLLNENGFEIDYVTVSGSGTYMYSAKYDGITEIQPGTYVFSDEHLSQVAPDFDIAATVLGTISNQTGKREFTIDIGSKAITTGDGKPIFKDYPKARIRITTEEHIQFKVNDSLAIGQKTELIPAHICPTVNLYDFLTIIKDDEVIARWNILARGKNY